MTVSSVALLAFRRKEMSEAIFDMEEKYLAIVKTSDHFNKTTRASYILELQGFLSAITISCLVGFSQSLYMLITGQLYYDTALSLSTESYSWQWWLQMFYQGFIPIHSALTYSCKEFLLAAPFYYISVMFKHQAHVVSQLYSSVGWDSGKEYEKLRLVSRDTCQLLGWVFSAVKWVD